MPRAASTSAEEKTVKKAPRKRATATKPDAAQKPTRRKPAVRKTAIKTPAKTATKKPTKKPATKKPEPVDVQSVEAALPVVELETESSMSTTRKAPTKFAAKQAGQKSRRNQYVVIGLLLAIGIGSSAAVGMSDTDAGQINVAQTIKERNERMANLVDVDGPTFVAPTPTPSQQIDGGLTGLRAADPSATPVVPPAPLAGATSTASSTVASSTATSTAATASGQTESAADQFATDTATTTVEATDPTETAEPPADNPQ